MGYPGVPLVASRCRCFLFELSSLFVLPPWGFSRVPSLITLPLALTIWSFVMTLLKFSRRWHKHAPLRSLSIYCFSRKATVQALTESCLSLLFQRGLPMCKSLAVFSLMRTTSGHAYAHMHARALCAVPPSLRDLKLIRTKKVLFLTCLVRP